MRVFGFLLATTLGIGAAAAQATDLDPVVPGEIDAANSGLYLRADAGWAFLEWNGGEDDSDFVLGGGIGYQFNDMLRSDITVDVSGGYDVAPGDEISTTTVLGNVYFDLANDTPLTPYIGVGAGYGFVENNPDGLAIGLAAGVALGVTPNLDLDAGYRYRDIMSDGPDLNEHQATVGMRFKF